MREFIKQNRPIRNLATNPLVCATICALHRDRKKQIPAERMRLYAACCEMLLERCGLLRVPIETKIDFVHRTFQEFLGAKAAVDENDMGLLVKNATNDQWREHLVI